MVVGTSSGCNSEQLGPAQGVVVVVETSSGCSSGSWDQLRV